jgi:hypothetical protein
MFPCPGKVPGRHPTYTSYPPGKENWERKLGLAMTLNAGFNFLTSLIALMHASKSGTTGSMLMNLKFLNSIIVFEIEIG